VRRAGYYAPFDLYTPRGTRIEVKSSEFRAGKSSNNTGWIFNIHRHGKVNNDSVDFYVLRAEPGKFSRVLGFRYAFYLIIPAREMGKRATIVVSVRSLLTRYARHFGRFDLIKEFDKRSKGFLVPLDRRGRPKNK
jgi:hypothetical protein